MRRAWLRWTLATLLVVAGLALTLPNLTAQPGPVPQAAAPTRPALVDPAPSPVTSRTSSQTTTVRSSCRAGEPRRLVMPALGVDAAFERIGLDTSGPRDSAGRPPLGNPSDRRNAGWYADGPQPGSGRGTVLTNGHTYRNGSAIFREDFSQRVQVGQLVQLRQDNGSVCSYRITRVWREVNATTGYPQLVATQHLYDFGGPERLLLATCSGSWNAASQEYDDISVVLAVPVATS
ncbi:MAG: class F sortase [Terrabacter sp.]